MDLVNGRGYLSFSFVKLTSMAHGPLEKPQFQKQKNDITQPKAALILQCNACNACVV